MIETIKLQNSVTNDVLELDMLNTPFFILESCNWGQIIGTHNSTAYAGQIGVTITGTVLGTRSVEIVGWIIADTEDEMDDRKDYLNHFINPLQEIVLTYKNYSLKFKPDNTIGYSTTKNENNEVMVKFKINGTAEDPLFKDTVPDIIMAMNVVPLFHFPLIIPDGEGVPMGVRSNTASFVVNNKGDISTGMTIVLKAIGNVTNPKITSAVNQKSFAINDNMVSGQKIIITTDIGRRSIVKYDGKEITDLYSKKDFDSDWLQVAIGENLFVISADAGVDNLEVEVEFTNKYLEVEGCY